MRLNKKGLFVVGALKSIFVLILTSLLLLILIEYGEVQVRSRDGEKVYRSIRIKNEIKKFCAGTQNKRFIYTK